MSTGGEQAKLGLDAGDFLAAIARVEQAIGKYTAAIDKAIKASINYNRAGQAADRAAQETANSTEKAATAVATGSAKIINSTRQVAAGYAAMTGKIINEAQKAAAAHAHPLRQDHQPRDCSQEQAGVDDLAALRSGHQRPGPAAGQPGRRHPGLELQAALPRRGHECRDRPDRERLPPDRAGRGPGRHRPRPGSRTCSRSTWRAPPTRPRPTSGRSSPPSGGSTPPTRRVPSGSTARARPPRPARMPSTPVPLSRAGST